LSVWKPLAGMGQRNLCGRWTVESATSSVRSFMNYIKGITTRRTRLGVEIVRVHYTADPERDSEWAKRERQKYSSQAAWDREQEIVHEAGGGELLFALERLANISFRNTAIPIRLLQLVRRMVFISP